MRTAVDDGEEVFAGPDAPITAICPECGRKVVLRRHGPAYAYHHTTDARDCSLSWKSSSPHMSVVQPLQGPEYFLFVAAIREAIKDALNGRGPQALDWLFEPAPQATLELLLELNAEETRIATMQAVERLKRVIAAGQSAHLRRLVATNAYEQVVTLLAREV